MIISNFLKGCLIYGLTLTLVRLAKRILHRCCNMTAKPLVILVRSSHQVVDVTSVDRWRDNPCCRQSSQADRIGFSDQVDWVNLVVINGFLIETVS